jgi:FkbM family methyltransferase
MGSGNLQITEMWMVDVLEQVNLDEGTSFVDVGANIGQTLLKLRSLQPDMPYIGIEPNPACVFYLQQLIRQNHFNNCQIIPAGVYTQASLLSLNFLQEDDADSSASVVPTRIDEIKGARQAHYVPLLPFDSIISHLDCGHISVIKIDVEGAELEVLQSMVSVLSKHRPILLLEILPSNKHDNIAERRSLIHEFLSMQVYQLMVVIKSDENRLVSLQSVNHIRDHDDLEHSDFLAVPVEDAGNYLGQFHVQ